MISLTSLVPALANGLIVVIGGILVWAVKSAVKRLETQAETIEQIKLDLNTATHQISHALDLRDDQKRDHDNLIEMKVTVKKHGEDLNVLHGRVRKTMSEIDRLKDVR